MSDPIIGGLLGGIGSFATSMVNNLFQSEQNRTTREREDNAVQRRVADLKAAGLSPVLAAGQGASASTMPAIRVGDPIEAAANMMQQTANVAQSAAEKARIEQVTKREKFATDIMESQSKQEKVKADSMEAVQQLFENEMLDVTKETPKGVVYAPYVQRELSALREGALKNRQTEAAGSLSKVEAEQKGLDLKFWKDTTGSGAFGGVLLKLLQMIAGAAR